MSTYVSLKQEGHYWLFFIYKKKKNLLQIYKLIIVNILLY